MLTQHVFDIILLYILILSIIYNVTHLYNIIIRVLDLKNDKFILNNREKIFTLFSITYILTYIII
jgi:hypothetical protein